ncbi:MAG: DNA ligase D [Solirubrobacterales bacterium]|nr:DNA ligase D [Solirubrobacterales bacterium]
MPDRLHAYRDKRAQPTPEPGGVHAPTAPGASRFVVQEHHATRLHWDLRLERDGVLVSWAVPNGLPEEPGERRLAVHTEDHPLEYLSFEGEIPRGSYGAGTMTVWDHGTYDVHEWTARKVEVTFHGERLRGRYGLFPTARSDDAADRDWLVHRMDAAEDPGRTPMPDRLEPMLARPGPMPDDEAAWAFEVKWDGVRAVCFSTPGALRLSSRGRNDITRSYPELRALNRALSSHRAILDGEIVAFDADGRPDFGRLQGRMHVASETAARRRAQDTPVVFVLFDLLWLDGHPLVGLPYEKRRERLVALGLHGPHWQTPEHVVGRGADLLALTGERGLEGVVAKRLDSRYEPGRRSACWVKIKHAGRVDVVVGGWEPGQGRRRGQIGSLLVGVPETGGLRFAGKVGTGFTDAELDRLRALLEPLRRDASPFAGPVPRGAVYVEPVHTAEVEFRGWTRDGKLRAPSYKGLRAQDDAPVLVLDAGRPVRGGHEIVVEQRTLRVTNLDKVLYPAAGFRKRDVLEYLAAIAPVLLPHLEGRPLTLKRYPGGVEGAHFYEKQCPAHHPDWVRTVRVTLEKKAIDFCLAEDVATLVWLGNLADLELHTSLARAPEVQRPTMVVFDLDPGPPATIVECCRVGLLLEGMFAGLGLATVVKTSGSKGLQVYLPLNTDGVTYDDTKPFARIVAELLEQSEPELALSRQTKALRAGRVLVDWSQNDEHKTTVNVYSLRARARPTVSTPVTWDEVRACAQREDPDLLVFDPGQVLARVREQGDLFADALSVVQRLPELS